MNQKFGKTYKLCSKKVIAAVFQKKQAIKVYPLRLFYLETPLNTTSTFQITFAVPKKKLKRAPDRNRVKRLLKEALRKNKGSLEDFLFKENKQLALFLVYTSDEVFSFETAERKIVLILNRLIVELKNNEEHSTHKQDAIS